jgi:hypothetical protein
MVEQLDCTAAVENHWLMFLLLGWEMMAACLLSHLFFKTWDIQVRWPYAVLWIVQIVVALGTVKLVTGRPRVEESPLEPINKRIWLMFIFLSINVVILNLAADQPLFAFLPALATLSSFAFTFLTTLVSRKFMIAGIFMFATGIVMARLPHYSFLIYGLSWLIILEAMAVLFYRRRGRWLAPTASEDAASSHPYARELAMKG